MRTVLNALLLFAMMVVGCAKTPSSAINFQDNAQNTGDAPSRSTLPTSGSIGTEGGGNVGTLIKLFWHNWDELANCLEEPSHLDERVEAPPEWQVFADNLQEISEPGHNEVEIGDFKEVIQMEYRYVNGSRQGKILIDSYYFQYDQFRQNILLIQFANRYGGRRSEWSPSKVSRAAYYCAPGTKL